MISKKEIAVRIRAEVGYQYKVSEIEQILDAFTSVVLDSISVGEEVKMPRLGKFFAKYVKGRTITKPGIAWMKGKIYEVAPKFLFGFTAAKEAKLRAYEFSQKLNPENVIAQVSE